MYEASSRNTAPNVRAGREVQWFLWDRYFSFEKQIVEESTDNNIIERV